MEKPTYAHVFPLLHFLKIPIYIKFCTEYHLIGINCFWTEKAIIILNSASVFYLLSQALIMKWGYLSILDNLV